MLFNTVLEQTLWLPEIKLFGHAPLRLMRYASVKTVHDR